MCGVIGVCEGIGCILGRKEKGCRYNILWFNRVFRFIREVLISFFRMGLYLVTDF